MALTISLQVSPIPPFLSTPLPNLRKLVSNSTEPPFDRHDWIVHRPETGEEVRYIIDYYSAPPLSDGSPVFSLDVRPALDSVAGVQARVSGWKETWNNAATRENKA